VRPVAACQCVAMWSRNGTPNSGGPRIMATPRSNPHLPDGPHRELLLGFAQYVLHAERGDCGGADQSS
jgi:hypothetical protein